MKTNSNYIKGVGDLSTAVRGKYFGKKVLIETADKESAKKTSTRQQKEHARLVILEDALKAIHEEIEKRPKKASKDQLNGALDRITGIVEHIANETI